MALQFTKVPDDVFNYIQENAGFIAKTFDPDTRGYNDIICATSGGIHFTDVITFQDWGEDIDNVQKNTKELKRVESREIKLSGTAASLTKEQIVRQIGLADVDQSNSLRIIPRNEIKGSDFETLWFVCDYGLGGFIAIKIYDALNTNGFDLQTSDKSKGNSPFEFTAHPSIESERVPYEVYVEGEASTSPEIVLNKHSLTLADGDTYTFTTRVVPSNATITWSSSDSNVATVSNGVVTAEGTGNAIITASITQSGVTYNDTCTVIVTE